MSLRTILIDDEQPARDIVRHYLKDFPEIEILGEFADGFSGLKAIQELKPDLVFLDVQMPKLTGLELLDLLDQPPLIIFSTAYDQYAIKAFEMNAIDYLLKPYSKERFTQAIQKALSQAGSGPKASVPVQNLVKTLEENPEFLQRMWCMKRLQKEALLVFLQYIIARMHHLSDQYDLRESTL